ncbi:transposon Ty3-I Gag-Pol polyprotein [Trichonephila clavipes]|nr:transposon Ty3-I Gag-Pol polyprotein [Trichonephila clavipes]
MPNEWDSNQISHVAVKPPPFWKHNPAPCDLVLKPPENGKYEALIKHLFEVHSESEDSKIRTLLQGLELGDQRPSHLLTRMRSITGDNVGEPLLKSLWLGCLPNGTQTILAALNENLDQLATVADKINDLTFSQGINSVAATSKKTAQLEQQIAQFTQQVSELSSFVKRSRSPARNSNHFRAVIRKIVLKGTKNPQMDIVFTTQILATKQESVLLHALFARKTRMGSSGYPVISKSFAPHAKVQQDLTLYVASGTKIPSYGTKRILLDLGLRCQFTWSFVIADVRQPIIGVDFLKYFNLLVDAKHHIVIDANSKLSSNGQLPKIESVASNLTILVGNTKFDTVLKQYPELINPSQPINVNTLNQVYHGIETKCPPVFSKPRRLSPTILKAVKKEFEYLKAQGIIRPLKSPWASPLYVVKKSNGEYRPCGDYRRLNSVTVPDRDPVSHIQDCT